jgi:hypothetical protein
LEKGSWRQAINKVLYNVTKNYTNGIYKGEISNGSRTGWGVYYFITDNQSYWGDFLRGESNGKGIYIIGKDGEAFAGCRDCSYYAGNWASDWKNGIGKCYNHTGKMLYHGFYSNDKPTEKYPQIHDDSEKFECIEYEGGNIYLGETLNGFKHGLGIFFYANGDAWYGEWKDNQRNGNGIELQFGGSVKSGRWNGDTYLED